MNLAYFQLIDRIVTLSPDERTIGCEALVPQTSTIFEGHFPGHPLMPGVLLIEAMAQTSGWLVIALTQFERMPFLCAVKQAKLRRFVSPGERLAIDARIVHEGSGFAMTAARIRIADQPVCDAEITFRVVPFPNDEFRAQMEAAARRLEFPMKATTDG
jgi:3-hydroxyacyl-[acyl-carrier-protein] dehydratase